MRLSLASSVDLASRPTGLQVIHDGPTWDALIARSTGGNVLQSHQWGEFRSTLQWLPTRLAQLRGDDFIAGAQILLRKTPFGNVAYVPHGPVVAPGQEEQLSDFCAALHHVARDLGAFCLTMEPAWADEPGALVRFQSLGF